MNKERELLKRLIQENDDLDIGEQLYKDIEEELKKPEPKGIRVYAFNIGGWEALQLFSKEVKHNATLYLDEGVKK